MRGPVVSLLPAGLKQTSYTRCTPLLHLCYVSVADPTHFCVLLVYLTSLCVCLFACVACCPCLYLTLHFHNATQHKTHPHTPHSIKTLWEEPTAAGVCVPDVLRQLWQQTYAAESTTLAVVGPQDTEELLGLVQHAFGGMRRRTTATAAAEEGDDGGSSEVKRFKAGSTTTAAEPAVDGSSDATTSSSHTASGDSSSDGSSDSEAGPLIPAAGTGAGGPHSSHSSGLTPEAVLHIKAQQEGADSAAAAAGDEQCSRIAAPHHHHNHNQQQQGEQHAAAMPQPPTAPPPQQQQRMGHHRYPVDVVSTLTPGSCGGGGATTATTTPRLVRVCPQRELRELEVVWYIPAGAMVHSGCVRRWRGERGIVVHMGWGCLTRKTQQRQREGGRELWVRGGACHRGR